METARAVNVTPQLVGYPRIGPKRELKWALERRWSGRLSSSEFLVQARDLRSAHLAEQRELIGSAVDDFFLYDEVLEAAMMFGGDPMPAGSDDDFDHLTALARGTTSREAWEMTKWFDTNYHYVVPVFETDAGLTFRPLSWREPVSGPDVIWAVLGPYSLAKLSKVGVGVDAHRLATAAAAALASWVRSTAQANDEFRLQLDEPSLGMVLNEDERELRDAAYAELTDMGLASPPLVSVQFGHASDATVRKLGNLGFAVQVRLEDVAPMRASGTWETQPEHVVTVMDGRSVWPDHFEYARRTLEPALAEEGMLRIVPSTSLMFLPYTVDGEELPPGFQFAREKAKRLGQWAKALAEGGAPEEIEPPMAQWPQIGALVPRDSRPNRRAAQQGLNLPRFPTTSTGSLPQTTEVRHLRVQLARGEIDEAAYLARIDRLISDAIRWQETKGMDVLVHGEFERTDMVEYFAERMDGFFTTRSGWVLSYGSRCTRPPILDAPPSIAEPVTVREWQVAQAATSKPVKGMLTGPVTIVNWSFRPPGVSDDVLFWAVAGPIAEEVGHLVDAGARIVQIDEPAVRERWPLPTEEAPQLRAIYARGVRAALNRVFNQPVHVQMHTHMCYGDFGEIVPLWSEAGVDVASIEFSRSKDDSYIHQFYELFGDGHLQIGPGVFDVHSPHSPGVDVMTERLDHFRNFMDDVDLWINPDCGLKTRSWEEIDRQLGDMVAAANRLRAAKKPAAVAGE
jgi:5-methyltetrahydropteroyltriglutamate--homocysteine methyltransferase